MESVKNPDKFDLMEKRYLEGHHRWYESFKAAIQKNYSNIIHPELSDFRDLLIMN